jgi:hypothetical protein
MLSTGVGSRAVDVLRVLWSRTMHAVEGYIYKLVTTVDTLDAGCGFVLAAQ